MATIYLYSDSDLQIRGVIALPAGTYHAPPGLADQHWQGELRSTAATQPELGPDVDSLAVSALTHRPDILRLTISDKAGQRWQVTQLAQQLWPSGDFSE